MRSLVFLLSLIMTFCLSAIAWAGDISSADLPLTDTQDHWHLMTLDDATSTSKCIGDPKTPLCAIETVLACFVRKERELCLTGMGVKTVSFDFSTKRSEYSQRYWVAGVEIISEENKAAYAKVRYLKPQVGDIAIRIRDARCYSEECNKPVGPPTIYLARRNGDKWMTAGWATPRW